MRNFHTFYKTAKENPNQTLNWWWQDISYLYPFSAIVYAHIPLNLGLSKLSHRSTIVNLLGYFKREDYTNFLTKEQVLFSNCEMSSSRKEPLTLLYNSDYLSSLIMIIHPNISKIIYSWPVNQLKITIITVPRLQFPPQQSTTSKSVIIQNLHKWIVELASSNDNPR